MATPETPVTLELAIRWAKSGHESDKVYRFLFLHPDDLFTIPKHRSWPIAHQIVFNGDVFLLKRVLALYYDDSIDIRTRAGDTEGSTLLDVARSRQNLHKEMCKYVEDLFLGDELMRATRENNWIKVKQLLQDNPSLVNENRRIPPIFVLHYLVQNGDRQRLEDYFDHFRFDVNVRSADRETPMDLARRLRREDLCPILELSNTRDRSDSDSIQPRSLAPTASKTTTSVHLPYPIVDPFPKVNLSSNTIVITETGDYELHRRSSFPVPSTGPSGGSQASATHTDGHLTISTTDSTAKLSLTPVTPATKDQLMKNLRCPLTLEVFVDPVIASDGQTYERAAIIDWIEKYECSPTTGEHMDGKLTPNDELRKLIQSIRK